MRVHRNLSIVLYGDDFSFRYHKDTVGGFGSDGEGTRKGAEGGEDRMAGAEMEARQMNGLASPAGEGDAGMKMAAEIINAFLHFNITYIMNKYKVFNF